MLRSILFLGFLVAGCRAPVDVEYSDNLPHPDDIACIRRVVKSKSIKIPSNRFVNAPRCAALVESMKTIPPFVFYGSPIPETLYKALTSEDRFFSNLKFQDVMEYAPSASAYEWATPRTTHRGVIQAFSAFRKDDRICRPFQHALFMDIKEHLIRGNACRNPDGTWTVVPNY